MGIICYALTKWRMAMAKFIKLISQIFHLDHNTELKVKSDRYEEIWSDTYPSQLISQIRD